MFGSILNYLVNFLFLEQVSLRKMLQNTVMKNSMDMVSATIAIFINIGVIWI